MEITEASTARERHGRDPENGQEEEEVGPAMKRKEEGREEKTAA